MSLFIGNISSTTKISELEDLFNKYGRCKVSLKTNYGFVDYDSLRDAEDALSKSNKKIVAGSEIELKWSDRMNKERYSRRRHYSKRSRSRSKSKDSRGKKREDRHRHHRKRSYSNKRKYSRDHSKSITRNDRKKSRRKSRHSNRSDSSRSRSRSHS